MGEIHYLEVERKVSRRRRWIYKQSKLEILRDLTYERKAAVFCEFITVLFVSFFLCYSIIADEGNAEGSDTGNIETLAGESFR